MRYETVLLRCVCRLPRKTIFCDIFARRNEKRARLSKYTLKRAAVVLTETKTQNS